MAETTQAMLAGAVKRQYGYYTTGVAMGGSGSTLMDAALIEPENTWVNHYVRLLSGAATGQERLVGVYAPGTIGFGPPLSVAVGAGDEYEISPVRHGDVAQAILDAVNAGGAAWMRVVTVTLDAGEDVALPVDCVGVLDVTSDGQPAQWGLAGQPGAMVLRLGGGAGNVSVQYLALANRVASDTDTLGMGEGEREALAFVKEYALHLLHEQALSRDLTGEAQRVHHTLMQSHLNKALTIEAKRDRRAWNRARSTMSRRTTPAQD